MCMCVYVRVRGNAYTRIIDVTTKQTKIKSERKKLSVNIIFAKKQKLLLSFASFAQLFGRAHCFGSATLLVLLDLSNKLKSFIGKKVRRTEIISHIRCHPISYTTFKQLLFTLCKLKKYDYTICRVKLYY